MKKNLALFDFDGTITNKDSLLDFTIFAKGRFRFYIGMVILFPVLLLMKLKILPGSKSKEIYLSWFFKGVSKEKIELIGEQYADFRLPQIVRNEAMEKINNFKAENVRIIVVSASMETWLKPWCDQHQLELISTRMEFRNNIFTGRFETPNCNGPEKVRRIKNVLNLNLFDEIHVFGDSEGDKEMFELGTKTYYRWLK